MLPAYEGDSELPGQERVDENKENNDRLRGGKAMSWISNVWSTMNGSPAEDLAFVDNLTIPGEHFNGLPIVGDECYVELYVESLRLEKARKFATTFHGVVYSFQKLARQGTPSADLAAISKPDKLAKLDSKSLGNVITVSRQLMGAVPWRGGTMHLELGLFSVKSGNLLSPVLDFVTQVSTTAGISFIGAVTPFVPLLTKGMDLIAGQVNDVALEVAFDADLDLNKSGTYAIISIPKTQIDTTKITVDRSDRKLLLDGFPLECGYCVFSIRRALQKADYGEIPELKEKFAALVGAIKSNNVQVATDALTAFRLAVLTSPDLIPADADLLVAKAAAQVNKAFPHAAPASGIARALGSTLSSKAGGEASTLAELKLYD
jgi:hypothetical protein